MWITSHGFVIVNPTASSLTACIITRSRQKKPLFGLRNAVYPVIPLDQATLTQGYGARTLRLLSFDCTKSWIYPDGGQSNGTLYTSRQPVDTGNVAHPIITWRTPYPSIVLRHGICNPPLWWRGNGATRNSLPLASMGGQVRH